MTARVTLSTFFTSLEPHDQKVGEFYVVRISGTHRATDFQSRQRARRVFTIKETTLERADSTLQLLMFVTAEKE